MENSKKLKLSKVAESILNALEQNDSKCITNLLRVLAGLKANGRFLSISDSDGDKFPESKLKAVLNGSSPVQIGDRVKLLAKTEGKKVIFVRVNVDYKANESSPELLMGEHEHAAFCILRANTAKIYYVVSGTDAQLKELKDNVSQTPSYDDIKFLDFLRVTGGELHFNELTSPLSHFTVAAVLGVTEWFKPKGFKPAQANTQSLSANIVPAVLLDALKSFAGLNKSLDYSWAAFIGMVGALLAKKIRIGLTHEQNVGLAPNLWVCLVGEPGTGKSPVIESMLRLAGKLIVNPKSSKEYSTMQAVDSAINATKTTFLRKAVKETAEGNKTISPKKIARQVEQQFKVEETNNQKFVGKIAVTTDTTDAALKDLLSIEVVSVMVVADELKSLLQSLDSNRDPKLRAQLLQAESSNSYMSVWRATQPSKTSKNATISIISGIQPDALAPFITKATNGDSSNDGLLNRFLLTVKNVTPADSKPNPSDVGGNWISNFLNAIAQQDFAWLTIDSEGASSTTIQLTDDAAQKYIRWEAHNKSLISKQQNKFLQSHYSKYVGLVHRLSLIYQVVLSFDAKSASIQPFEHVTKEALEYAIHTVSYLRSHARAVFSVSNDVLHTEAKSVITRIATDGLNNFTASELAQKNWTHIKRDTDKARQILQYLESFGLVRHISDAKKVTWRVNPLAKTLFKR